MSTSFELLAQARRMPLVAILRGLVPAEAEAVGAALVESGFRTLEVPLNRPGALECIAVLARRLPADAIAVSYTHLTLPTSDLV